MPQLTGLSWNRYLVGHQLTSDASAKMYSRQLIQGCRCLEVCS